MLAMISNFNMLLKSVMPGRSESGGHGKYQACTMQQVEHYSITTSEMRTIWRGKGTGADPEFKNRPEWSQLVRDQPQLT
jgi:hypothetical protein